MVSAISSSIAGFSGAGARPSAGLGAELAQCQRQLGDWTACASAKTPEGQAKIAEISDRIGRIKTEMQKADSALSRRPAEASLASTSSPGQTGRASGPGYILDEYA